MLRRVGVLVTVGLVLSGCTGVRVDAPKEEAYTPDTPLYHRTERAAKEMASSGRRMVATGQDQVAAGQDKIRRGERMVAEGTKASQKAGQESMDPDGLSSAAAQIRQGNELIAEGRREIETAQRQIREGRIKLEEAAALLQTLEAER